MTYSLARLHADGPPPLPGGRAWPAARARVRRVFADLLGELPARGPVAFRTTSVTDCGDHDRHRLLIDTVDSDVVPALLLVPHGLDAPASAVLALHPTHADGKASVATASGAENRRYGLELVGRGHVVLAPDTITAGERMGGGDEPFHTARHDRERPELSALGKMLSDHLHCLDVLAALPQVDAGRIGAIGHSLGGYNAFVLAGADERIAATVTSCGFAPFAGDTEPHRWGRRAWFSHLPALSDLVDAGVVPFEWHEVVALVAPRALWSWMGAADPVMGDWRAAVRALGHVGDLYASLGAGERFASWLGHSGHDFPPLARAAAYAFLAQHLDGRGPLAR